MYEPARQDGPGESSGSDGSGASPIATTRPAAIPDRGVEAALGAFRGRGPGGPVGAGPVPAVRAAVRSVADPAAGVDSTGGHGGTAGPFGDAHAHPSTASGHAADTADRAGAAASRDAPAHRARATTGPARSATSPARSASTSRGRAGSCRRPSTPGHVPARSTPRTPGAASSSSPRRAGRPLGRDRSPAHRDRARPRRLHARRARGVRAVAHPVRGGLGPRLRRT